MNNITQRTPQQEIFRIVAIYAVSSGLWIYMSDSFLGLVIRDPAVMSRLSIYKGFMFIALTATLLYFLIASYIKRISVHISELNQTQKMLANQKALLDIVIEGTTDAIYIKDADGRYLLANAAVARFVGKPVEDIVGRDDRNIFPAADARVLMDNDKWVMTQNTPQTFEEHLATPDGEKYFLSTKGRILDESGAVTGIFGVARDTTERKQVEMALRKSEENFRAIIKVSPVPLALNDERGNITYLNEAFEQVIGYTLDDIPTIEEWWPRAYPDEQYRQLVIGIWQKRIEESIRSGNPFVPVEINVTCKDGQVRTFMCCTTALEDNYVGSNVVVFYDITDQKRAELEKISLEQQLQQTQKLESLGVLAGGIAHDFNNILAIIIGHCALAKLHPEATETHIGPIEKAADRAAELCRQMLAYAGKASFILTQVNMSTLAEEMINMLKATLGRNVVIKSDFSGDIPVIKGDASQIRQILMNLIINASEAIGDTQGEIVVSLSKTVVRAEQFAKDHLGKEITAGRYVCLEVADNGCGMDDDTKRRIFEPFYTTKFTGRGLGMSAVLGIISAHKGALQLSSNPGQGSVFKIFLPVDSSESVGGESLECLTVQPWQGSGTILLVEDEELLQQVAKDMLEVLGFSTVDASNGREALEIYQKNAASIRLVITDIGMPVMDGYALIRELKKLDPKLPIIVSSGFGDAVVTSGIANEEVAGLVSKPYNMKQLQEVLQSVVGNNA